MRGTFSKRVWLESSWICFLNVVYLALLFACPLFPFAAEAESHKRTFFFFFLIPRLYPFLLPTFLFIPRAEIMMNTLEVYCKDATRCCI